MQKMKFSVKDFKNMREYGFSMTGNRKICPHRRNKDQRKPIFWYILRSVEKSNYLRISLNLLMNFRTLTFVLGGALCARIA